MTPAAQTSQDQDPGLKEALRSVYRELLGCGAGENVLLVTDLAQDGELVEAMFSALHEFVDEPQLMTIRPRGFPGEEPPEPLRMAMQAADAVFFAGTRSITYSRAVQEARSSGTRVMIAVGITRDILKRTGGDFAWLHRRAEQLRERLQKSSSALITCPRGTSLGLRMELHRPGFIVDGFTRNPGVINWIPAGSAHIAPDEGTAEGVLVVNGSLVPLGILDVPVRMAVDGGYVREITGGPQAGAYRSFLEEFKDPGVFNIGELAVGVNPGARLTGQPIEDERIEGGIVVGIGGNVLHGGVVQASTHTDAVLTGATLSLDGETIIKDGKLLI